MEKFTQENNQEDFRTLGFFDEEKIKNMMPEQKESFIASMKEVDEASFEEKFLFPDELYEEFLTSKGVVVTTLEENNEMIGYALSHDMSTCIDALVEQGDDFWKSIETRKALHIQKHSL